MKICNIVGARPQFIKYFPVSKAIQKFNKINRIKIIDILIHTGQHYDYNMSKVFFDEFGIKEPDYHLEIGSANHGEQTAGILKKTEKVLCNEKPDIVVVYGDTNSTLGGALAASKLHIPVAHVEAGLRSFNKRMPEEINRILVDHSSTYLFCPSEIAVKNLEREGFSNCIYKFNLENELLKINNRILKTLVNINNPMVVNTGDVMYDVFLYSKDIAQKKSNILEELKIYNEKIILLTMHRAENTDNVRILEDKIQFINRVTSDMRVIFPIHPRTKKSNPFILKKIRRNIEIVDPVGYFDLLILLDHSDMVLTDSGGLQKEAFWSRTPCITLRKETEWVETIDSGWNNLYENFNGFNNLDYSCFDIYGEGNTSEKILNLLTKSCLVKI